MRKSLDVLDFFTTKVKVANFSFLNEKSYNKTVIDFNFGRHKDLSTLRVNEDRKVYLPVSSSLSFTSTGS